jgi:hypothetical protein
MKPTTTSRSLALLGVLVAATLSWVNTAGAQTSTNRTVRVQLRVAGQAPTAVASIGVAVTCSNIVGTSGGQTLNINFPRGGGQSTLTFALQSNSACRIAVQQTSSAGGALPLGVAAFAASIGGNDVTLTGDPVLSSPEVAAADGTSIVVDVAYPVVTVRKQVIGDEPTAGFAYPMLVTCDSGRGVLEVASNGNLTGNLIVPEGPGSFEVLTIPGLNGGRPMRFYDWRTPSETVLGASDAAVVNGTYFFVTLTPTQRDAMISAVAMLPTRTSAPVTFSLKAGESRQFGAVDFPGLTARSFCSVTELDAKGASLSYTSLGGTVSASPVPSNTARANGSTLTVSNAFTGDLIVSVAVQSTQTFAGIVSVSVSCDRGGPVETFLLKDRQSRVYRALPSGTTCVVQEPKTDSATLRVTDNSGEPTDGRVTVRATPTGCTEAFLAQRDTLGSTFPDCAAVVLLTNSYSDSTATAATLGSTPAPSLAAPTGSAASSTTPAPATPPATQALVTPAPVTPVAAAPADAIVEQPSFVG